MRVTSVLNEDAELIVDEMKDALGALGGTTLLVTGAGGFLCSYFLDVVAAFNDRNIGPPCRVVAVDNFVSGLPQRIEHLKERPDLQFVNHDVSRPMDLSLAPEWIIHGASIASPSLYRRKPLETIDVNVGGTRRLLEMARQEVRSMLFLSSSEIYGDPFQDAIPTPEDYRGYVSCTGPRACYDESKRLGETLCAVYHRLYGVPVKIVRPFNVYGPGQRLDDGRIIPDLMRAALEGGPIVLYSDGRASRAFCYVRDAVRGMFHVLFSDAHGEAFNVGADREVSIAEVAQCMVEVAAPPELSIDYLTSDDPDYLTDNPRRRCPSLDKIMALADWRPQVDLKEGLARTLRSYREIGR
jgi:dTDP-glucose 4,6-dehydratase/UDP-glucuronate decarboxylase